MMFNLGIEAAIASTAVKMRCGCNIQSYGEIVMWTACTIEHEVIMILGWERTRALHALEQAKKCLIGKERWLV